VQETYATILPIGLLGVLLRDALDHPKATFFVSALRTELANTLVIIVTTAVLLNDLHSFAFAAVKVPMK